MLRAPQDDFGGRPPAGEMFPAGTIHDTKMARNNQSTRFKLSRVERRLNLYVIGIFIGSVSFSLLFALLGHKAEQLQAQMRAGV